MDRCQVGVRVGEGGVDLDGSGVALHGPLDVVHLLEGVAHVGVGVGKGRLDSNGLFVVHQRLVQFPLLLEDRRQVGVGRGKLWENLESFQV